MAIKEVASEKRRNRKYNIEIMMNFFSIDVDSFTS